jgi:hypothetical protein
MADVNGSDTHTDPIDTWLSAAIADAERRGLPQLRPLLEGLAQSTRQLRAAEWNDYVPADGRGPTADGGEQKAGLPAEAPPPTGIGGAKAGEGR